MTEQWKSLASIPPTGAVELIDSNDFWRAAFAEFGLDCTIKKDLAARIEVLPHENGVLFRGSISGVVALPCNCCTEEALVTINQTFDSFEPYPDDPYYVPGKDEEVVEDMYPGDEAVIRQNPQGHGIDINPSALAWQEFSLALPVKPVCSNACKGLCPVCGCNLNKETCGCNITEADPRLAPLRGLVITKK